jgi:Zn-dependent protease with chaperone function
MAMNFFQSQEAARRSSRLLIVLFVLAVVAIVLAVNGTLAALYLSLFARHGAWAREGTAALPHLFFPATTFIVLLMIGGGTAQQMLELRAGGEAVARMVGARPIDPATQDPAERRLRNVIEEMSLASGIPAPRAYVLDGEDGINAFAAGLDTRDAIVTVTSGALARLTRDELQGVIGHEFSHILNGDMALNVRLIGVVQGLLLLALFGRFLVSIGDGRDRRDAFTAGIGVTGLAFLAIGYIGVFFGRLIKAGVSRQREFLADASSVQFTRNPDGIGGALRKLGGLGADAGGSVQHLHAETLSHMFMAPVSLSLAGGLLASHPPLAERLHRIYGRHVDYLAAAPLPPDPTPAQPGLEPLPYPGGSLGGVAGAGLISPLAGAVIGAASGATERAAPASPAAAARPGAALHASIGSAPLAALPFAAQLQQQADALGLRPALEDAAQAQRLVLAMLLDPDAGVRERQRAALVERYGAAAAAQAEDHAATLQGLPPGWRLPLLDLSMPALRTLDNAQREALLQAARVLIEADGRVTLAEFLLFTVLKRRLAPAGAGARAPRRLALADAPGEAALVLSLIAGVRLPADPQRAFAAGRSLLPACGPFTPAAAIELARVSAAFDRLAGLAPLQMPQLVKACIAAAFVDGSTEWKAASCLRTLCAALDCPLPPQLEGAPA